ncbi:M15 family metallopeptidase [Flavobacterium sp. MFBS3-15]|uniref:M15 family metallopeptidase n=1 Tax=Flavobacterium sp. MFBS3-15 TaxID=2989816 RepID=UPI0022358D7F|nr:M15 family metallopeptidase [Flavobacterium sp. MFBS3-15]MCW4468448.1 M15 family metallopeptidase [Flavobacterium sp. MFBS3-15]
MKILKVLLFTSLLVLLCAAGMRNHAIKLYTQSEIAIANDSVDPIWAEVDFEASQMLNRMAYADTANFMHAKIYPCARCFLRPEVAEALDKANEIAKDKGVRLVIYDCYRPYPFQQVMYDIVNDPRYVAPPGKGSNHNRGAAVDISLADESGELLDMGGAFDDFSEISHYNSDNVSKIGRKNRKLLRNIMKKAGFTPLSSEWWHFDYKKVRYETASFIWDCR